MDRRWKRAAAVFLLLPGIAVPKSGLIQVTDIHFQSRPDSTRFVFDVTGPFEVHSERAFNPDRIYFDLSNSRPWVEGRRYATKAVNDDLVQRVRIAETAPGKTRIVFDLKVPSNFKMSRLESPNRMVIEIAAAHPVSPGPAVMREAPVIVSETAATSPSPEVTASVAPLPYVSSRDNESSGVAKSAAFVYPPGYGKIPRVQTPTLLSNAPGLLPVMPTAPFLPYAVLPDAAIPLGAAGPPRKLLASALPSTATGISPIATASTSTTKAVSGTRPVPYDSTPHASENASRSLTRALGLKVNRIVIDAGHGGHDDGTIGPNGVLEKDVVLDVALRLAKLVQAKMGADVILTRSDDTFIPLQQRTAIANDYKADLFLSIHANSSPAPSVAGTETFFLNFTNSPAALDVAARENAGSDKNVGDLKDVIQSITLNDKIAESETFAQQIQNSIFAQASRSNAIAKNRGVKRAPFVVLIGASMPSVLAEIGFLSNARDESNLNKAEYRQKIAESLLKGLSQYAQSLSHFEVAASKAVPRALN